MTNPLPLKCAVTGSNGYVGRAIGAALRRDGCPVIDLCRRGAGVRTFSLDAPPAPGLLQDVEALIHCAYDFAPADEAGIRRINIDGSIRLFEAARAAGVGRIIFISSMSAFPGCRSMYGRAKLAVESGAGRLGVVIVRPGLVYGPEAGGMVGALLKSLSIPFVTPLVGRGLQSTYLAHEDDLGELLIRLVKGDAPAATPILAAHEKSKSFKEVLQILAQVHGRQNRLYLPVPAGLVAAGLKLTELAGLKMRLRGDSLVSLLHQDPRPDFSATARIGAPFREFNAEALRHVGAV
jgi:nucleoside-diphosphate-sugar epimerase